MTDMYCVYIHIQLHRGADKSLAPPTSRCILFDDENISFDASLVTYINSVFALVICALFVLFWPLKNRGA